MFSFLALSLWIAPILLFASVITAQTASANPKVESDTQLPQLQTENNLVSETPIVPVKDISGEQNRQINQDPSTIEQVTSVSQLSDVQPTDWAFGALQSLDISGNELCVARNPCRDAKFRVSTLFSGDVY